MSRNPSPTTLLPSIEHGVSVPVRTIEQSASLLDALELDEAPALHEDSSLYLMEADEYLRHVRCQAVYYGRSLIVEQKGGEGGGEGRGVVTASTTQLANGDVEPQANHQPAQNGVSPVVTTVRCRLGPRCSFFRRTRQLNLDLPPGGPLDDASGGAAQGKAVLVAQAVVESRAHDPFCVPAKHDAHPLLEDDAFTSLLLLEALRLKPRLRQEILDLDLSEGEEAQENPAEDDPQRRNGQKLSEPLDKLTRAMLEAFQPTSVALPDVLRRAMQEAFGMDYSKPARQRELESAWRYAEMHRTHSLRELEIPTERKRKRRRSRRVESRWQRGRDPPAPEAVEDNEVDDDDDEDEDAENDSDGKPPARDNDDDDIPQVDDVSGNDGSGVGESTSESTKNGRRREDGPVLEPSALGSNGKKIYPKSIPIEQVHPTSGKMIRRFVSYGEAVAYTGISRTSILRATRGERPQAGGYVWRIVQSPPGPTVGFDNEPASHHLKRTTWQVAVEQIDPGSGRVVRVFSSVGEAHAGTGADKTCISKVIHGKQKLAGGYMWRKAERQGELGEAFRSQLPGLHQRVAAKLKLATPRSAPSAASVSSLSTRPAGVRQAVQQFDMATGNVIAEYTSLTEASTRTQIPRRAITKAVNGFEAEAGGYFWKFVGEEPPPPAPATEKNLKRHRNDEKVESDTPPEDAETGERRTAWEYPLPIELFGRPRQSKLGPRYDETSEPPLRKVRVLYEGRTMESVGGEMYYNFPAVQECGPWYDAGDGPDSPSRYSSYPFMFEPTLAALADDYNEMATRGECVPARLNTDSAEALMESIDRKLTSLRQFYDHDELSAEVKSDEKEYRLSLRYFSRAEEQEKLARLKEVEEDDQQYMRTAHMRKSRSKSAIAAVAELDRFVNMPVVFEADEDPIPADEIHGCDRKNCPVCDAGERHTVLLMKPALQPRAKIPMPQWCVVDFDFDYNDFDEDQGDPITARKAKRSISMLREMRIAIPYIVDYPENPVARTRRLVREGEDADLEIARAGMTAKPVS